MHNEWGQEVSRNYSNGFLPEKILNVQVYVEVELVSGNIIVIMTVVNINVKGVKDTIRWKSVLLGQESIGNPDLHLHHPLYMVILWKETPGPLGVFFCPPSYPLFVENRRIFFEVGPKCTFTYGGSCSFFDGKLQNPWALLLQPSFSL